MSPARRRLRSAALGFATGAVAVYALGSALLLLDLANPNFEAMYEMTKPRGLLAILRFTTEDWPVYLVTGSIGALVGLATSGRPLILRLLAIPLLALVGSFLLVSARSAWVDPPNVDEQPYALLVAIALAGVTCLISAAWIAWHARPSRMRSPAR
jgi:uncharacterized membrane protein